MESVKSVGAKKRAETTRLHELSRQPRTREGGQARCAVLLSLYGVPCHSQVCLVAGSRTHAMSIVGPSVCHTSVPCGIPHNGANWTFAGHHSRIVFLWIRPGANFRIAAPYAGGGFLCSRLSTLPADALTHSPAWFVSLCGGRCCAHSGLSPVMVGSFAPDVGGPRPSVAHNRAHRSVEVCVVCLNPSLPTPLELHRPAWGSVLMRAVCHLRGHRFLALHPQWPALRRRYWLLNFAAGSKRNRSNAVLFSPEGMSQHMRHTLEGNARAC